MGRIAWFDITTTNLGQSKEFCGKLLGWHFNPVQGTDQAAEIAVGDTAIGTLQVADGKISPFNGIVYVQVSDIQAICKTAKELGGVIAPGFRFNLPDGIRAPDRLVLENSTSPCSGPSQVGSSREAAALASARSERGLGSPTLGIAFADPAPVPSAGRDATGRSAPISRTLGGVVRRQPTAMRLRQFSSDLVPDHDDLVEWTVVGQSR